MSLEMDKNRKVLIDLLSAAIRGKSITGDGMMGVDWEIVYTEAEAHEIAAMLFPAVKDLGVQQRPDPGLAAKWRKAAIADGLRQIRHLEEMKRVFDSFGQAGIPVIALKGLILRELYPHPELRSMSDADVLVHKDDVTRAKELLKQLGYYSLDGYNAKHIGFHHCEHLTIELHWFLTSPVYVPTDVQLEERVWKNAVRVDFQDRSVLSLSAEDQLLHVCLHMASHIRSGGIGLRQLCDMVLLVENVSGVIDWTAFKNDMEHFGVGRFIPAVFEVCSKLLGMAIPGAFNLNYKPDDYYLEMLVEDVLSGGIFLFFTVDRIIGNGMLHYADLINTRRFYDKMVYYLAYIFPSPAKMSPKYAWFRKYPLLAPIAWMHRFILFAMNNRFFSYFKNAVSPDSKSVSVMKERAKFLSWLGLR